MDIADWLRGLGLEKYAPAFDENAINWDVLSELTTDDLKDIGVTAVGDRRRLLAAIAALGGDASPVAAPAPEQSSVPAEAERRQLTVMFCDLVGSTALSTRHDPEDLRELIGSYHRAVAEAVAVFDGFVAKYMGDGVLIYFGYPRAHEDDAERAVRAGLAAVEAVGRLPAREDLRVRLGIATGLAVVGDLIGEGAAQERGVVGETPNLAARLQGLAMPNTLVIAEATRRQVGGLFDLEDLGPQQLAGFGEAQRAWRVIGESGMLSRFEALRSGQTPLVGREEEVELLVRRWQQAKSGDGRVVLISGEPGIGKSRLTAALSQRIESEPHTRLRYFCSPHHQDSALYPFIGQLERAAGFARDDTATLKLDKLEALLGDGAEPGDISLIAEMLSLSGGERFPPLDLSPQRKKERTLAALLRQLQALVQRQPVLMIIEDLHWIDPTSRELVDLTVEKITGLPVLLVATYRPEFQPPWVGGSQVTVVALNRLARGEGATLVHRLAGNLGALPPDVVDEIVERADGVPLFVEELTKAVVEAGADRGYASIAAVPSSSLAVPATLHASLLGRLDRLGPSAKNAAQVGAAIGRDFSYELLAAAAPLGERELQEALRRLVEAGLVFQRGMPPTAEYLFKHALLRDAAYATLLRSWRRELHAQIADILHDGFSELIEKQPEMLAHHYTEAGNAQAAATYWNKAGLGSAARSAMVEAVAQFRKALDQLALLVDSSECRYQKLEFYSNLGVALRSVKGLAAPETGQAYTRARELWEQLGSPPNLLRVPFGQASYHQYRGELHIARRLNEELLELSHRRNDPIGLILGHYGLGVNSMFGGRFLAARTHLEEGLSLYDPTSHYPLVNEAGFHPHLSMPVFLAITLFSLGYPDQASARSAAAIAVAKRIAHPPSLAVCLSIDSRLRWLIGEYTALGQRAEELIEIAKEQNFPYWIAQGTICRGWATLQNGDIAAGASLLSAGSLDYRSTGSEIWMPHYLTLSAKAHECMGQIEKAVAYLDDALKTVERTGERWFAAEVTRLKGELLIQQADLTMGEALYRKALSISREQQAKSWELRAAMSLARLWREQGRRGEARDLLAPLYGWFTEGFGTADLKEAKALLDELA